MTAPDHSDVLDDVFLGCAVAAFVSRARAEGRWPGREATRRRAYRLYEDELADKNRAGSADPPPPRPS